MKNIISITVLALAIGGCASSQTKQRPTATGETAQTETPQEPSTHGGMMHMCPMMVEGTTVQAEDVEGGAAMVFTTTGDVAELRLRVARMAEMHNRHHGEGHDHGMGMMEEGQPGGDEPPHGGGMQGGTGMMGGGMMPPSDARSEEVEGGARLIFIPRDPADLDRLREHVGRHAEMMASGRCPMMSTHGH